MRTRIPDILKPSVVLLPLLAASLLGACNDRKTNPVGPQAQEVTTRTMGITGTPTRITADDAVQRDPAVSGDLIVWRDCRNAPIPDAINCEGGDIYLLDASTGMVTQITDEPESQRFPEISGNRIVWEDKRHGQWDVYLFDVSEAAERRLTSDPANQTKPVIDGDLVVWLDGRNGGVELFAYDLSEDREYRLANADGANLNRNGGRLSLSSGKIVWTNLSNKSIMMFDTNTMTKTVVSPAESHSKRKPGISADYVVWLEEWNPPGAHHQLFAYHIPTATETRLTGTDWTRIHLAISGNQVVYSGAPDGNVEVDILLFDLETMTETALNDTPSEDTQPDISGNHIVWVDTRGASGVPGKWDIVSLKTGGAPILSVSPDMLDFLTVEIGESRDMTFVVANEGTANLAGSAGLDDRAFKLLDDESAIDLNPDDETRFTVRFEPSSEDVYVEETVIETNGGNALVLLEGRGAETPADPLTIPTAWPSIEQLPSEPWGGGLVEFANSESTLAQYDAASQQSYGTLINATELFLENFNKTFSLTVGKPLAEGAAEVGNIAALAAGAPCGAATAVANYSISAGLGFIPRDDARRESLESISLTRDMLELLVDFGCPTSAVFSGMSLIFDRVAVPAYEKVIADPPSQEYHSLFIPVEADAPQLRDSELPRKLEGLLSDYNQLLYDVFAGLEALGVSTDRYGGALQAGDPVSASLQLQALLFNLSIHGERVRESTPLLEELGQEIEKYNEKQEARGSVGLDLDEETLIEAKEFVRMHGIPSEARAFLTERGVTEEQLGQIRERLLNLELPPKKLGHVFRDLKSGLEEMFVKE